MDLVLVREADNNTHGIMINNQSLLTAKNLKTQGQVGNDGWVHM